jgi:DNA primase catalytic core
MAMHFTPEFIDALLKRVNMMEIMNKYGIQVKAGQGANNYYVASFCCGKIDLENGRIKKTTQTYKCQSCKDSGNALHFLQRVVELTFHDAVIELAEMYNMELPVEDPAKKESQLRKDKALKLAADFYRAQTNFEYILGRGISQDVLDRHHVGYAPGGRALRNHLEKYGYTKQEMQEYKLINSKGLDSLFYRAVIPVYKRGKVIDLYGRAVDDTKSSVKHFYLYGDNILGGFDFINTKGVVKLFEAAIDRLAAESNGIDNGVDSGGAHKFTPGHARELKKKGVNKVMVIYDGDKAGREGAIKTGQILADEGIIVWIGELPDKQDPAKMLHEQGKDAFVEILQKPKTFERFKMYHELSKYSLAEIEKYLSDMKSFSLATAQ